MNSLLTAENDSAILFLQMKKLLTPMRLLVFSELFVNLSAGWVGVVLITPGFGPLAELETWLVLTKDILFAILCLLIAIRLREIKL